MYSVETGGDPIEAWTKATKSLSESERMTEPTKATESEWGGGGGEAGELLAGMAICHSLSVGFFEPVMIVLPLWVTVRADLVSSTLQSRLHRAESENNEVCKSLSE